MVMTRMLWSVGETETQEKEGEKECEESEEERETKIEWVTKRLMRGTKEEGRENGVYEEGRGQKRRGCEEMARV